MAQIKVAIEQLTLKGTFEAKREFYDELKAIVCYFSDSHREIVLICFDIVQLSVPFCNEI